jgi:hypothetical protein
MLGQTDTGFVKRSDDFGLETGPPIIDRDVSLDASNRGYKLLAKMGWKGPAQGLGKLEQGIKEPVKLNLTCGALGVGKLAEVEAMSTEATKERRKLDVEVEQTEAMIKTKEENAIRISQLEQDIKTMNKEFYCEICDKQYKNVSEMSNHLSSYDHHHKKRMRDLKEDEKRRSQKDTVGKDEKRRKEERRRDKEMQERIARAQNANSNANKNNNSIPPTSAAHEVNPAVNANVNRGASIPTSLPVTSHSNSEPSAPAPSQVHPPSSGGYQQHQANPGWGYPMYANGNPQHAVPYQHAYSQQPNQFYNEGVYGLQVPNNGGYDVNTGQPLYHGIPSQQYSHQGASSVPISGNNAVPPASLGAPTSLPASSASVSATPAAAPEKVITAALKAPVKFGFSMNMKKSKR